MPIYEIPPFGVPVSFPFEAYDCQLLYMTKVIEILETKQNGLLESPTGTGKTLCLLCACLGWREWRKKKLEGQKEQQKSQAYHDWEDVAFNKSFCQIPRIFYTSRTHSQLKQVTKELKKTPYRPITCALASREQLCALSTVRKLKGRQQMVVCEEYRRSVDGERCKCSFYNKYRAKSQHMPDVSMMDIEDIVEACKSKVICPYFKARESSATADVVMCPYNYLIDPALRKSLNIDIQNAILIFDEGHNIESACEDSGSFELSDIQLDWCVSEIEEAVSLLETPEAIAHLAAKELDKEVAETIFLVLKQRLIDLQQVIGSIKLVKEKEGENSEVMISGKDMYDIFERAGINKDNFINTTDAMDKVMALLGTCGAASGATETTVKGSTTEELARIIKLLFREEFLDAKATIDDFYRILVVETDYKVARKKKAVTWDDDTNVPTVKRTINFWCFSPSVAIQALMDQKVYSLIVTSGTLSPIESCSKNFGAKFTVTLENSHVISKEQLFGGVLSLGPNGESLISVFENRTNENYLHELARCVTHICKICPDGVLVAFASYSQMEHTLEFWRKCGQMANIEAQKDTFQEPRNQEEMQNIWGRYVNAVEGVRGAVIFAIARGKLTEGVDFTDRQCRAVVVCGLPYPPAFDPKVKLKKRFLNDLMASGNEKSVVAGQVWYAQQATKAINQTLGRVIRHRNDYGAVLLLDKRFLQPAINKDLSKWLLPSMRAYEKFDEPFMQRLRNFFECMKKEGVQQAEKVNSGVLRTINIDPRNLSKPIEKENNPNTSIKSKKVSYDEWLRNAGVLLSSNRSSYKLLETALNDIHECNQVYKVSKGGDGFTESHDHKMKAALDSIRTILLPAYFIEKNTKLPLNLYLANYLPCFLPKPYKAYWKDTVVDWLADPDGPDEVFKPLKTQIFVS